MKNKCNNLLKQSKKKKLKDISNKEAATSKTVQNTVNHFATDKGIQKNENITTDVEKNEKRVVKGLQGKVDIRTKDLIKDKKYWWTRLQEQLQKIWETRWTRNSMKTLFVKTTEITLASLR